MTHLNGTLHGPYVTWHKNGKKNAQGRMTSGLRVGRWIWRDKRGRMIRYGTYAVTP